MRKISDTIVRLASWRAQQSSHPSDFMGPDRLSTLGAFGSNPGALRARFYLPENLSGGAPLVVVLHGCIQNAAGYDYRAGWSQLADEAGFALLYPEQQRANNPNLCFNWFFPGDTQRDSGEVLSIRQMIETFVAAHHLDRQRIFITGLSAGGAMAGAMLAAYPEVFAAGAIIAGLPYGTARTVPEAFDRMRGQGGPSEEGLQRLLRDASWHSGSWPKISIWHGSADQTVVPSNAEAIASQWRGVHKLRKLPTHTESSNTHARSIWCNAAGDVVIELNTITSMGHGTPLGDDGLGAPGPYMLNVGMSSTREIAHFWGITDRPQATPLTAKVELRSKRSDSHEPADHVLGAARTTAPASADAAIAYPIPPTLQASGVGKIIEDALRAAGLMR